MPPRNSPTARQARLGAELRRMRERAGLTAREAATQLGVTPMRMSHIEIGRFGVSEERMRKFASHYGCADRVYLDALAELTGRQERGWWEKYQGLLPQKSLDLAAFEWHASSLRGLQIVHIPGLLQTEAYIRALFSYMPQEARPRNLDAIVDFRMQRQAVLERKDPVPCTVFIHEAALRMKVGDSNVVREQMDLIAKSSERPNLTVRVVPFSAEGFVCMGYAMQYMAGGAPQLDTVQIDEVHGSAFLDAEEELDRYRTVLRTVERFALGAEASRDFVLRIARES
ncbi:helix-turn-helix transcriptional regulator [Streptomyces sp. UNOB3_S3]|uniref:helix-turn-helix domain-containing protein n=1 Tax=Streptomyces sp. UNOB3_S3 TaxID=2871682 RepID=UPI001E634FE5|nr:helix-turn-helix transcriptional regulator [Streptomyces sp. UNOB3_S3]MCC3777986.1 helix-turn-helix domain-containing protein [Streptomyces sp. UNOB3_S3]